MEAGITAVAGAARSADLPPARSLAARSHQAPITARIRIRLRLWPRLRVCTRPGGRRTVGRQRRGLLRAAVRSYDPASGTYLGYDGVRHPCPSPSGHPENETHAPASPPARFFNASLVDEDAVPALAGVFHQRQRSGRGRARTCRRAGSGTAPSTKPRCTASSMPIAGVSRSTSSSKAGQAGEEQHQR